MKNFVYVMVFFFPLVWDVGDVCPPRGLSETTQMCLFTDSIMKRLLYCILRFDQVTGESWIY